MAEKKNLLRLLDPDLMGEGIENIKLETLLDMFPEKIMYKSLETWKILEWNLGIRKLSEGKGYQVSYDHHDWEGVDERIPYPELTNRDKEDLAACGMVFGRSFSENSPGIAKSLREAVLRVLEFLIESKTLPMKYLFGRTMKKEILQSTIERIRTDRLGIGIKYAIGRELYSRTGIYYNGHEIAEIFPTLRPETFGITPAGYNLFGDNYFWWPLEDKESRIKAITKIINENYG